MLNYFAKFQKSPSSGFQEQGVQASGSICKYCSMYSEESQLKLENFESHVSYFHRFFCKLWKGHMPIIGKEMKLYILCSGAIVQCPRNVRHFVQ